jgi:hypothetical protein
MTLDQQISHQRVKHIVSSYQLDGNSADEFAIYLADLLNTYSAPLIELALTETLVANWLVIPMTKGIEFLQQVHAQLQAWEVGQSIAHPLTPEQFHQITGLDPTPVFNALHHVSTRSPQIFT